MTRIAHETETISLTFDGNEFYSYGDFMFSALLNECRTKYRGSWAIYRGDGVMLVCSRDYDQRRTAKRRGRG